MTLAQYGDPIVEGGVIHPASQPAEASSLLANSPFTCITLSR
jgi:hypothetical protein